MDLEDLDDSWHSSENDTESETDNSPESWTEAVEESGSDNSDDLVEPPNVKEKYGVKRVRIPRAKNSWRTKTIEVADIPCAKVCTQARLRRGTKSVREIRKLQKTGEFLIPRKNFQDLVKSLLRKHGASTRVQQEAVDALQEAFECFAVKLFDLSNQIAQNSDRVTVQQKDFVLASKTLIH